MRLVTRPPEEAPVDPEEDARAVQAFIEAGTSDNGVFGVVLHWLVVQDAVKRLRSCFGADAEAAHDVLTTAFGPVSYVWLRRRDRVAQAVSWYKAIQTGVFVGRHAQGESAAELRYDHGKVKYLFTALRSFDNAWASYFKAQNLSPTKVYYEDLAEDHGAAVRQVLHVVGVDAANVRPSTPRHHKAANSLSARWIREFKDREG